MPSVTTKGTRAWGLLRQASVRPVDVILNNDSNGLHNGWGWDAGLAYALLALFGAGSMYASGLQGFREGVDYPATNGTGGGGQNVGYGKAGDKGISYRSGGGGQPSKDVASNAVLAAYWNSRLDPASPTNLCNHLGESYWASTSDPATNPAKQNGLVLAANQPLGVGTTTATQLQYQLWRALFSAADGGGSNVADIWWLVNGASTHQFNGLSMSSGTTQVPSTPLTLDLPVQARGATDNFEIRRQSPSASSSTAYPFAAFFQRVVRKNQTYGWAVNSFYSTGGARQSTVVAYINAITVARMCNYLRAVMYQQITLGFSPMAVVVSMFGVNDYGQSITKASFKADLEAEFNLWRQAWSLCGYRPENLVLVSCVGHPRASGDTLMSDYRAAGAELATAGIDVSAVDMSKLTSYEELAQAGSIPRYASSGVDTAHLDSVSTDNNSFNVIGARILDAVRASRGPGSRRRVFGFSPGYA